MTKIKTKITFSDGTNEKFKGNAVLGVSADGDSYECFTKGEISTDEAIEAMIYLMNKVDDRLECGGALKEDICAAVLLFDK